MKTSNSPFYLNKFFNKEQINKLFCDFSNGDNYKQTYPIKNNLKLQILDSKVLIDRWGLITNEIILHPSRLAGVLNSLDESIYGMSLWGATIYTTDCCPETYCILCDTEKYSDDRRINGRGVAIFNF